MIVNKICGICKDEVTEGSFVIVGPYEGESLEVYFHRQCVEFEFGPESSWHRYPDKEDTVKNALWRMGFEVMEVAT